MLWQTCNTRASTIPVCFPDPVETCGGLIRPNSVMGIGIIIWVVTSIVITNKMMDKIIWMIRYHVVGTCKTRVSTIPVCFPDPTEI